MQSGDQPTNDPARDTLALQTMLFPLPESHPLPIREFLTTDQPRHRLAHQGAAALSDAELLAVITGVPCVGEIFKEAVRRNSAALIVAHNHPSGDASPSPEDVLVTREIVHAGKLLDIDVLDHLVLGNGVWVSLRERGLGFDTW